MKYAYPIMMTQGAERIVVYIPDFQINTQGNTVAEAIDKARNAIGIMGIHMEDEGEKIPHPSNISNFAPDEGQTVTLVDIDFAKYRKKTDQKSVLRTVSLPGWLDAKARDAHINVSGILQRALKQELGIVG